MYRGQWVNFPISRFVKEIPLNLMESNMSLEKKTADTIPLYEKKDKSVKLYSGYINQSMKSSTTSNVNKPYSGTNILSSAKPVAKPKISVKPVQTAKPVSFTKGSEIKSEINYKVGDRVSHIKFGEGVVKDIDNSGVNTYVTIEFDTYGQRVLDSRFAKLNVIG
jgi:DNA helicase-2/ATP-dependent DNA helicase PcrA